MARLARPHSDRSHDDDDDEFPDVATLFRRKQQHTQVLASATESGLDKRPKSSTPGKALATVTTIRRRKLGPLTDNLLLRAWTPSSDENERDERHSSSDKENTGSRRAIVGRRTRNARPTVARASSSEDQEEDYFSAREELTITEDASIADEVFTPSDSDSDFSSYEDEDDADGQDVFEDSPPPRSPAKSKLRLKKGRKVADKSKKTDKELADATSRLRLDDLDELEGNRNKLIDSKPSGQEVTPPSTPPKSRPGLVSPRKLPRIPVTPHRPSSDMFWSQEFVDEWNDEHSPRKQLFPDATAARPRSPTKANPGTKSQTTASVKGQSDRDIKRTFEKTKHELAEQFIRELDTNITDGKLGELAASTGGIKLIWTNKLNTTAGRANWKHTTVRTRAPNGDNAAADSVEHKHFASIELAEKVIDNEHRLLNVLAHEFCHLANFMISRVTNNPHGREFKAWADKCSSAFCHRGIEVTTKHSYKIDFKYVWECVACGMEYKRHSKSIDPARHRCGSCKGELTQTKPVPRKSKAGGAPAKLSEYQTFMKEQMSVVREQNPKMSQKEIMKIVAARWAAQRSKSSTPDDGNQEVAKEVGGLSI